MEFRLLGPLEVRAGDGPLPLGGEKQRALLALLLLNANRVVSRERLIDGLWGDDPPETVVAMVQVYVSRLRKVLPNGVAVDAGARLRPLGRALRARPGAFRGAGSAAARTRIAIAAVALAAGGAGALARAAAGGVRAASRSRGVEAGRLEDLRLAALEERIEADLALGRHADLAGELEALIGEYPHRERLRGQLMLALYRQRPADGSARRVPRRTRRTGRARDRAECERLRRLEKQILTHDPALELRAGRRASPSRSQGRSCTESPFPFVGRAAELCDAARRCSSVPRRVKGGLVLISGEPGGGKTRLVRELGARAAERGVLVCYGMSDAAVTVPYQPVLEWFEFLRAGLRARRRSLAASATATSC